jgi:hypothetical protein
MLIPSMQGPTATPTPSPTAPPTPSPTAVSPLPALSVHAMLGLSLRVAWQGPTATPTAAPTASPTPAPTAVSTTPRFQVDQRAFVIQDASRDPAVPDGHPHRGAHRLADCRADLGAHGGKSHRCRGVSVLSSLLMLGLLPIPPVDADGGAHSHPHSVPFGGERPLRNNMLASWPPTRFLSAESHAVAHHGTHGLPNAGPDRGKPDVA